MRMGRTRGYEPFDTSHEVSGLQLEHYKPVSRTPIRKLFTKYLEVSFFFIRRDRKNSLSSSPLLSFCLLPAEGLLIAVWVTTKPASLQGAILSVTTRVCSRLKGQLTLGQPVWKHPSATPFHTVGRALKRRGTPRLPKTAKTGVWSYNRAYPEATSVTPVY